MVRTRFWRRASTGGRSGAGSTAALFYDAGKVAVRRADLNFKDLERDYGFGFRFNTNEAWCSASMPASAAAMASISISSLAGSFSVAWHNAPAPAVALVGA